MLMLKKVIVYNTGMSMVFDERGMQISECQGPIEETLDSILTRSDEKTLFYVMVIYRSGSGLLVGKSQFERAMRTWIQRRRT